MVLLISKSNRIWTNVTAALSASVRNGTNVSATSTTAAPTAQAVKDEITPAMIRTLYRDFVHIVKAQQNQPKTKHTKEQTQHSRSTDPLQHVRDLFRQPLLNDTSNANTASAIESRYQQGVTRFAFLRMNTTHYKPRSYNHSTSTTTGTERYIYKNGQRYSLHSIQQDGTLRNQKGYVISPYDGKNLDPQSVTRHRQNLKRAGFINNTHAKGMF